MVVLNQLSLSSRRERRLNPIDIFILELNSRGSSMAERGVIEAKAFPSHQMHVSDFGTHKYPINCPFQSKQFDGLRIGVTSYARLISITREIGVKKSPNAP